VSCRGADKLTVQGFDRAGDLIMRDGACCRYGFAELLTEDGAREGGRPARGVGGEGGWVRASRRRLGVLKMSWHVAGLPLGGRCWATCFLGLCR
jgi:hypothetical protein